MGISELRQLDGPSGKSAMSLTGLGRDLVRAGLISHADAELAQIVQNHCDAPLERVLKSEGLADEAAILDARAARAGTIALDAGALAHYGITLDGIDPAKLVKHALLPLRDDAGKLHIATHRPEALPRIAPDLPGQIAELPVMLAPRQDIQTAVANLNRAALTEAAQARVPQAESCRTWREAPHARLVATLACLAVLVLLTVLFPTTVFGIFVGWATLTLIVSAALKIAAFTARMVAPPPEAKVQPVSANQKLPTVSVLVPLFRETEIAHALVARLSRLTYPKCLLDVVLVLEEKDEMTQQTLAEIDLPPWMRAVVVPDGKPRTKPRAMNYALDFCEGDIIGIFDAEDAPDPDQITQVARRFQVAPPDVVCLQGILDYYNPRQNWLARCFTIEYATWFRIMLPGMARLGFAIPLGGTTLYFRRHVLEALGGWDAHNVTEDADLGFRLARQHRIERVRQAQKNQPEGPQERRQHELRQSRDEMRLKPPEFPCPQLPVKQAGAAHMHEIGGHIALEPA